MTKKNVLTKRMSQISNYSSIDVDDNEKIQKNTNLDLLIENDFDINEYDIDFIEKLDKEFEINKCKELYNESKFVRNFSNMQMNIMEDLRQAEKIADQNEKCKKIKFLLYEVIKKANKELNHKEIKNILESRKECIITKLTNAYKKNNLTFKTLKTCKMFKSVNEKKIQEKLKQTKKEEKQKENLKKGLVMKLKELDEYTTTAAYLNSLKKANIK